MRLTLNLPIGFEERLYESGKRAGLTPDETERKFAEVVQEPPIAEFISTLFYIFLLQSETPLSAEKQEEFRSLLQPFFDRILRQGTAEELETLLPKMPDDKPKTGAEAVAMLEREGVLGAWAGRDDIGDSADYARQLRRQAETRNRT